MRHALDGTTWAALRAPAPVTGSGPTAQSLTAEQVTEARLTVGYALGAQQQELDVLGELGFAARRRGRLDECEPRPSVVVFNDGRRDVPAAARHLQNKAAELLDAQRLSPVSRRDIESVHYRLQQVDQATWRELCATHTDDPQALADALVAAATTDKKGYRHDATVVVLLRRIDEPVRD